MTEESFDIDNFRSTIGREIARVNREVKENKFAASKEITRTVLPLLSKLAEGMGIMAEEIEEELSNLAGDIEESVLFPEDADLFGRLVSFNLQILSGMPENTPGRKELEDIVSQAKVRLEEISVKEEEDEDEQEEEDEESADETSSRDEE